MIVRHVIMTFKDESTPDFLSLFENYKSDIRAAAGCSDLKLIQNNNNPNEICTLSIWESENHLNRYRSSELFGIIWPKTKLLFSENPKATTYQVITDVI